MGFTKLSLLLLSITSVLATQVMHRPDNFMEPPNTFATEDNAQTHTIQKRANGKTSFAYFTNWGIYGANFRS